MPKDKLTEGQQVMLEKAIAELEKTIQYNEAYIADLPRRSSLPWNAFHKDFSPTGNKEELEEMNLRCKKTLLKLSTGDYKDFKEIWSDVDKWADKETPAYEGGNS